eukprot:556656-Amphidinium_carterae.1
MASREAVQADVKENARRLKTVGEPFNGDKEIVLNAVKVLGAALEWAADSLKSDREKAKGMRQTQTIDKQTQLMAYGSLRREVVMAAVKQAGSALKWAADSLKSDREIVLSAVKQSHHAFEFAGDCEFGMHRKPKFMALQLRVQYNSSALRVIQISTLSS